MADAKFKRRMRAQRTEKQHHGEQKQPHSGIHYSAAPVMRRAEAPTVLARE
jgi:hypothetical protein